MNKCFPAYLSGISMGLALGAGYAIISPKLGIAAFLVALVFAALSYVLESRVRSEVDA